MFIGILLWLDLTEEYYKSIKKLESTDNSVNNIYNMGYNMKIIKFLQMNDLELNNFLSVILSIQLAIWGLVGLDAVGLQIPILRQFIGFIYLIFVPGILILRILKIHNLGNIETLLYTVGLSIITLMFTGFFMNMIYPFFGISRPISLTPLIITISAVVLVLCVLSYIRDKDFAYPSFIDLGEVFSPPVLFVCLIPFMAVFGTYLVNYYHNNTLLMLMIILIAIITLLIAFDKFIPKRLYSLSIFLIAISLIYHLSLISPIYINLHDLAIDFFLINSIIASSKWDWTIPYNYNATLSTVMLAPIFCNICAINVVLVLNIIYYTLCPFVYLGLYGIFQRITEDKIAFLSAFCIVIVLGFPGQAQLTAEIFFVLFTMLMIDKKVEIYKKRLLSIIFAISLVVSHYGTSYLFMFALIFVLILLFLTENPTTKRLWEMPRYFIIQEMSRIAERIKAENLPFKKIPFKKRVSLKDCYIFSTINKENKFISINFVSLFVVFTLMWYMYVSNSSALNTVIHIGDNIAGAIFTEFLSPDASRGATLLTHEPVSLLHRINKVLQLIVPFLIAIGILKILLKHRETKLEPEYIGFSLYWFALCLGAIVIPYFAVMNPMRLYRLSLFFMAPFAVIGGITVISAITKRFRFLRRDISVKQSLQIISIFFVILLLFNTGFIFEIANDCPNSISLSQESIKKLEYPEYRARFYIKIIPEQDIFSAKWLSEGMKNDEKIYASFAIGERALVAYGGLMPESTLIFESPQIRILSNTTEHIKEGSYIYLGAINVLGRVGIDLNPKLGSPIYYNMSDSYPLLNAQNKIYTNGGSDILWN